MEIKYNQPIQVTELQYSLIMSKYQGFVAGLKEEGKFYIKVWLLSYCKGIKRLLS